MTLVYNNIEQTPQTHIYLIGVGNYPYLKGGSQAKEQKDKYINSLGQLSSPMASVKAFYDLAMRLKESEKWITPLGSIEILLSPSDFSQLIAPEISPPTISNITASYFDWKQRCDLNEDNTAIFLFCGHGLQKVQHFLLGENFGEIPGQPWTGAFSFDDTRRAFHLCKAKTQCFFVDACRQLTPGMVPLDLSVTPLESPDIRATDCLHDLTLKASAANESAYGKTDSPSFFTSALIAALEGKASSPDDNGTWIVTTGNISRDIHDLLGDQKIDQNFSQRCICTSSHSTELVKLTTPPSASLNISCDPSGALPHATLSYRHANNGLSESRQPEPSPWSVQVPAGIYKVQAEFVNQNFQDGEDWITVKPPVKRTNIKCHAI